MGGLLILGAGAGVALNQPNADSVQAATTITQDWGRGYCASVDVTTEASGPVTWSVPLSVEGTLTSIWNAEADGTSGNVMIHGTPGHPIISPGETASFGYCATGAAPVAQAAHPVQAAQLAKRPRLRLSYDVKSWSSGATVNLTVLNQGPDITSWQVDIPWRISIKSLWSATSKPRANHLRVTNASWNGRLATGQSTTFGFNVSGAVTRPKPCKARTSAGHTKCRLLRHAAPAPKPTTSPTTSPTASPTASPTVVPPLPLPADFKIAPYVDMAAYPTPDLAVPVAATRIRTYHLAFITAAGGCTPAWGGFASLGMSSSDAQAQAINKTIGDLQRAGGKVSISFGGAVGTELARSCGSAKDLANAYRAVIEKYGITRIDFDIEGAAQQDHAANVRRGEALAILQDEFHKAGKTLTTTFTLPVLPTGLTSDGLGVLTDTAQGGGRVDLVNVMAMDYGPPNDHMGQSAIDAATQTAGQLEFMYPGTSSEGRITRVGLTPMIGENDLPGERFTLEDAKQVRIWAAQHSLGGLAWWSVARDVPCPKPNSPITYCSGTSNPRWAYAQEFAKAFTAN